MTEEAKQGSLTDRLREAVDHGVPQFYANSYTSSLGTGDVTLLLERNFEAIALLNMSYTTAKSLSISLGLLVSQIEERAGREIMTSSDIDKLFAGEWEQDT